MLDFSDRVKIALEIVKVLKPGRVAGRLDDHHSVACCVVEAQTEKEKECYEASLDILKKAIGGS